MTGRPPIPNTGSTSSTSPVGEVNLSNISFESLYYTGRHYESQGLVALWANEIFEELCVSVLIDRSKFDSFSTFLRRDQFPAQGGYEHASPFKKAGNLFVALHAENPFTSYAPDEGCVLHRNFSAFSHCLATFVGFTLARKCLHGATLQKEGHTSPVRLENPIRISKHFFVDLIEAATGITPMTHYRTYSLLFESLAYKANPTCPYDEIF